MVCCIVSPQVCGALRRDPSRSPASAAEAGQSLGAVLLSPRGPRGRLASRRQHRLSHSVRECPGHARGTAMEEEPFPPRAARVPGRARLPEPPADAVPAGQAGSREHVRKKRRRLGNKIKIPRATVENIPPRKRLTKTEKTTEKSWS